MRAGRPLRFLGAVLGGWAGLRLFVLWPEGEGPRLVAPAPFRAAAAQAAVSTPASLPLASRVASLRPIPRLLVPASSVRVPRAPEPMRIATAAVGAMPVVAPPAPDQPPQALVPPPLPERASGASRWSGSLWAIVRGSGEGGGVGSSQLGGSQAGARLAYALGEGRRVSLVARVASPLEGGGREAALGVEWRPFDLPVRMFAEQRIALDDGKGGPSAGLVGGVYRALPRGFRLEGYGQAGVIARGGVEGFADGAVRVARPVALAGPATLDLGAGAWGGAQRGAERIDLGPTLGVSGPVAGRNVRLSLDYRARVAGRARPGSGPALSLGTDF